MAEVTVNEMFGPTIQGEGPHAGEPCLFVRLGRCNLDCVWCDTPYSWDWNRFDPAKELRRLRDTEVVDWCVKTADSGEGEPVRLVVLSGGEPMLQHHRLQLLTQLLYDEGFQTDVETNGTIAPDPDMVVRTYVVSPKLRNSGIVRYRRIVPGALEGYNDLPRNAALKFVVERPEELDEVAEIVALAPALPVYVMPQGRTVGELVDRTPLLALAAHRRGWNFTTRKHILQWGNVRGR